jgi:hypothetical protein
MKVNKIICDVCEKEVDVNVGLALIEYIYFSKVAHLNVLASTMNPKDTTNTYNPQPQKQSFDLCTECADKVVEFIKSQTKK